MKTQLVPFSSKLAAVLGTEDSEERFISVPRTAGASGCGARPEQTQTALAMIEAALDRLELGTFGLCTRCGCEICLERLELDPSVLRCQVCEDSRTIVR